MSQVYALFILQLLLKGMIVLQLTRSWSNTFLDPVHAALLAWVVTQALLIGSLLVASPFGAVGSGIYWASLISLFLASAASSGALPTVRTTISGPTLGILVCAAIPIFALCYRGLYFYDNTWDALVYGLPRIAFWHHSGTLLTQISTETINIVSNEWNGELIALQAWLATGHMQAVNLAGVEIWIVTFGALIAWCRNLGIRDYRAPTLALFMMSCPAVMGLAMTVKGDLLAAGLLVGGLALATAPDGDARWNRVAAVVLLLFGAGAKISILPVVCLLCVGSLWRLWRTRMTRTHCGVLLLLGCLSCSRYLLNMLVFGTPFKRVTTEQSEIGFATLGLNLAAIPAKLLDWHWWDAPLPRWVLSLGLGACGWIALSIVLLSWIPGAHFRVENEEALQNSRWFRRNGSSVLLLVSGAFAMMAMIPWQSWSLRYHLGWLLIALVAMVAPAWRALRSGWSHATIMLLFIAAIVQFKVAWQQGEMNPTSFDRALERDPLERKLAWHPYLLTPPVREIHDHAPGPIVILNRLDSAILPFLGANGDNDVQLTATGTEFLAAAKKPEVSIAIISGRPLPEREHLLQVLAAQGFLIVEQHDFWCITRRPEAPGRTLATLPLTPRRPSNPNLRATDFTGLTAQVSKSRL